jgi:hypothetical protein
VSWRSLLRAAFGGLLLAVAVGLVLLARGTADAAGAFRSHQAVWQRGLEPVTEVPPGRVERLGERVLGIGARSDLLRAYQAYRSGLANVIPGTTYPQTRARFEAIERLDRLRGSLRSAADRAAADVVLGVVLVGAADGAGQQRDALRHGAVAAFVRAVAEDPANATAKIDLEALLQAAATRPKTRARPSASAGQRRENDTNPRNPTAPARGDGTGF